MVFVNCSNIRTIIDNSYTVEPPIKDTPNKGHRRTNLSIKDKMSGPNVSIIRRFHLYKR